MIADDYDDDDDDNDDDDGDDDDGGFCIEDCTMTLSIRTSSRLIKVTINFYK